MWEFSFGNISYLAGKAKVWKLNFRKVYTRQFEFDVVK